MQEDGKCEMNGVKHSMTRRSQGRVVLQSSLQMQMKWHLPIGFIED